MNQPGTAGGQGRLHAIDGGGLFRRDSVARLHQFQGDHPEVQFTSPTMALHRPYTALIPAGTIPRREPRDHR